MNEKYDIVGDIHGDAELQRGCCSDWATMSEMVSIATFQEPALVGDLIDRGAEVSRVYGDRRARWSMRAKSPVP